MADELVVATPEAHNEEPVADSTAIISVTTPIQSLSDESKQLLDSLLAETDERKAKELTQLFNANQNKKTMVRVSKLSDLLDTITDQALARFTARPDEISNKELFDGLKVVQDLIERGQKQVSGANDTPLIQVNQQTNEVNIGTNTLSRESRERVKSAVLALIGGIAQEQEKSDDDLIIADIVDEEVDEDVE